jgi:hypothetical protein
LHDHWGGQDRIVVMDIEETTGSHCICATQEFRFLPPPDHVVPQGAASVEITVAWTNTMPPMYDHVEVWYRTAASPEPMQAGDGPIASGDTVAVASTNADNDLPHQRLSAWEFLVRVATADGLGVISFQAVFTVRVEALGGLDIPLYPGHPDAWNGATEIALLSATQDLMLASGPFDLAGIAGGTICLTGCPIPFKPDPGAIVPFDADHVTVVIEHTLGTEPVFRLGLAYHGADTRDYQRLEPMDDDGARRVYVIPLAGQGDGPYAQHSLWEFWTFIEEPTPDGWTLSGYTMTATAHRLP